MKTNKKVIIYARIASVENDPEVNKKLEAQLDTCREYCDNNNLDVMTELRAFGPDTAEQTQALLSYLQSDVAKLHNLSGVVVVNVDRVSRNTHTTTSFEVSLEGMGMELQVAASNNTNEQAT